MNARTTLVFLVGVIAILTAGSLLPGEDQSLDAVVRSPDPIDGVPAEILCREVQANVESLKKLLESRASFVRSHQDVANRLEILAVLLHWTSRGGTDAPYARESAWLRSELGGTLWMFDRVAELPRDKEVLETKQFAAARHIVRLVDYVSNGEAISIRKPSPEQMSRCEGVYRSPLMRRAEQALNQAILPSLQSKETFAAAAETCKHDVYLIHVMMITAHDKEHEFSDEKPYINFARRNAECLNALLAALDARNYEKARLSVDSLSESCAVCHATYR